MPVTLHQHFPLPALHVFSKHKEGQQSQLRALLYKLLTEEVSSAVPCIYIHSVHTGVKRPEPNGDAVLTLSPSHQLKPPSSAPAPVLR